MNNTADKADVAKVFLVDAYAMIYRAYFAFLRAPRMNSKHINTSAIFGFVNSFTDLVVKQRPTHVAVCFDSHGPTFRHELFPEYKANRDAQPEDISIAVPYVHRFIEAMRIRKVEMQGYEADDLVGTLATTLSTEGTEITMVTPDKDYAQLIGPNVSMLRPKSGGAPEVIKLENLKEHFGVDTPEQFIDILGLWGDSSDNIPGCPGVGEKRAGELIATFGSIDGIYSRIDEVKGKLKENLEKNKEQVLLSRRLATIVRDAPLDIKLEDIAFAEPDWAALDALFAELEIKGATDRIQLAMGIAPTKANDAPRQMSLFDMGPAASSSEPAPQTPMDTAKTTPHKYHLLTTAEELDDLCQKARTAGLFCFDTETTSLETYDTNIVGFSVALKEFEAYYVAMPQSHDEAAALLSHFAPALLDETVTKVGQNMKFDIEVLAGYGIEVRGPQFDTMIAHFLLHPGRKHNMDAMAEEILHYTPIHIEELIGSGARQTTMDKVPIEQICEYAAEDADVTLRLFNALRPEIDGNEELKKIFYDIEMPLVDVLADMETTGVCIDSDALGDFAESLKKQIAESNEKIKELAGGIEFNISSPKQVGEVLFEKLKIDPNAKKTKTGGYATNEETLQKLAQEHPIVAEILNYRGLLKLLNTYAEALPKMVNGKTGRVHTSYNQTVVVTGRLSSSNPNLQNIPVREESGKMIRKAFVASKDHVLVAADYSQVELRIMAHFCQDEHLLNAFRNGEDIHRATAAKIYGVGLEGVTTDMRRKAKTANFGIIYGISAFGLAERLDIPRKEAKELIDGYFENFPGVKAYMDKCIEEARKTGVVRTLFGRVRELPDISSRNAVVRGVAERNAINAPIQGTAADIIKVAMVRIHDELKRRGLKAKMILQVHDELVLDTPKEEVEAVSQLLKEQMEAACSLSVPLTADVGTGHNWLEAH